MNTTGLKPEYQAAVDLAYISERDAKRQQSGRPDEPYGSVTRPAARLIDRLEGVRQTSADQYQAKCPAHDDSTPSLSVKECDDGRVLLHCHGGCDYEAILDAVGMTVTDIMPERRGDYFKPRNHFNARHALEALDRDTLIVAVIANDFLRHGEIDDATFELLLTAAGRISEVRDKIKPRRHKP